MASLLLDTYPSNSKGPRLTNRSPSLGRSQVSASNFQRSTTPSFRGSQVRGAGRTRLSSPQASLLNPNASNLNPNAAQFRPKENPLLDLAADLAVTAATMIAERETQLEAKDALSTLQSKLSNHAYGFNTQQLQADGSYKTIHNDGYLELKSKDAWQNREQAVDGIQQIINENVPSSPAAKKVYLAQATAYGTGYTSMYNRHAAAALKEWEHNQLALDLDTFSNELTSRTLAITHKTQATPDDLQNLRNYAIDQLTQLGQTYSLPPIKQKEIADKVITDMASKIADTTDPLVPQSFPKAIQAIELFQLTFTKNRPDFANINATLDKTLIQLHKSHNSSVKAKEQQAEYEITRARKANDRLFQRWLYGNENQRRELPFGSQAEAQATAYELFTTGHLSASVFKAVTTDDTTLPNMSTEELSLNIQKAKVGQLDQYDINNLATRYKRSDVSRIQTAYNTFNHDTIKTDLYSIKRAISTMMKLASPSMVMAAPDIEREAQELYLSKVTFKDNKPIPSLSAEESLRLVLQNYPDFQNYSKVPVPKYEKLPDNSPMNLPASKAPEAQAPSSLQSPAPEKQQTQQPEQQPAQQPAQQQTQQAPKIGTTQQPTIPNVSLDVDIFGRANLRFDPVTDPQNARLEIYSMSARAIEACSKGKISKYEKDNIMKVLRERLEYVQ